MVLQGILSNGEHILQRDAFMLLLTIFKKIVLKELKFLNQIKSLSLMVLMMSMIMKLYGDNEFIFLACDIVWDVVLSQEVVNINFNQRSYRSIVRNFCTCLRHFGDCSGHISTYK